MEAQIPPLIVDDFGVKYVGKENAQHLLDSIQKYFKCSSDWDGEQYCRLTIKWDYRGYKVHLLMPTYVQRPSNVSSTSHSKFDRTSPPTCQEEIWHKRKNCKTTQQNPLIRQGWKEVHPRSNRRIFIFGPSSQRNNACPPQHPCI
jgi:hypothetical protein